MKFKTRTRNKIVIGILCWIGLTIWAILAGWFFNLPGASDIFKTFLNSAGISGAIVTVVNCIVIGVEKMKEKKESKGDLP